MLPAFKTVFSKPTYLAIAALWSLVIFVLLVYLPVWTTPGNDLLFQLGLFTKSAYGVMVAIALLNGMLLSMQTYVRKFAVVSTSMIGVKSAATGFGIVTGSVAATLGCAACYSSVLALLGLGGTVFVVEHRFWFAAFSLILTIAAIHKTSKQVMGECTKCAGVSADATLIK